jgi:hypothetical protein
VSIETDKSGRVVGKILSNHQLNVIAAGMRLPGDLRKDVFSKQRLRLLLSRPKEECEVIIIDTTTVFIGQMLCYRRIWLTDESRCQTSALRECDP